MRGCSFVVMLVIVGSLDRCLEPRLHVHLRLLVATRFGPCWPRGRHGVHPDDFGRWSAVGPATGSSRKGSALIASLWRRADCAGGTDLARNSNMHRDLDPDPLLAKVPWLAAHCGPPAHVTGLFGAQGASVELPVLEDALSALDLRPLLPASIRRAVRRRQIAWIGGRLCAERSLQLVGLPSHSVPRGPGGEPVWPQGVAGSITHTELTAYAVVVRRTDGAGIGIDSERVVDQESQQAVAAVCCNVSERTAWIQGPDAFVRTTLLFAAKEAFYKAAWPALQRFINFDEVAAHGWDTIGGTILLHTTSALPKAEFEAAYCFDEALATVHVSVNLDASLVTHLAEARGRPTFRGGKISRSSLWQEAPLDGAL
jgi:enterobactin synthetase component D